MKNLRVYSNKFNIKKNEVHSLVKNLSVELNFSIQTLEINFISGEEIQVINKSYLEHNYTTDIITFNYSTTVKLLDGEIFISVDDAKQNAEKFKVSLSDELVRLIIHGILHLLHFDDKTADDKKIMKRMENKLLSTNKFILL